MKAELATYCVLHAEFTLPPIIGAEPEDVTVVPVSYDTASLRRAASTRKALLRVVEKAQADDPVTLGIVHCVNTCRQIVCTYDPSTELHRGAWRELQRLRLRLLLHGEGRLPGT